MKKLIVVDLDDTLIDITERKRLALNHAMSRNYTIAEAQWYENDIFRQAMSDEQWADYDRAFIGPRFLDTDKVMKGGAEALHWLRERGHAIAYVTGRYDGEDTMLPGTLATFEEYGVPMPDDERVYLFLKPNSKVKDISHKRQVFSDYLPAITRVLELERGPGIGDREGDAILCNEYGFTPCLIIMNDTKDDDYIRALEGIPGTVLIPTEEHTRTAQWRQVQKWFEEHLSD